MKYIPNQQAITEWIQQLNYYHRMDNIDMASQMIAQLAFYGYEVEQIYSSYRLIRSK